MLNIGIIGLGGAGQAHYARFRAHSRVERVLGYDIKRVAFPGAEIAEDLDRLLDQVDAVSITTPDHEHASDIERCLERGKHVLVEKPMVASLAEADALESVIAAHPQLVFAVHHQMRYVPAFSAAKEIIASGALGQIFYVEANYWHDMRQRSVEFDDWRMRGRSQSVIFAHGCHPYDLVMHLLDGYPTAHATYVNKNAFLEYPTAYTSATTLMEFAHGVTAKVHVNNCCVFPQLNDLIILGDRGSYVNGALFSGEGRRQIADYGFPRPSAHNLPGVLRLLARKALGVLEGYFTGQSLWRVHPLRVYNHAVACQVIVDNFVAAVLDGEPPLVGFEDARRVVRLCEELEQSALHGKTVPTGEFRP